MAVTRCKSCMEYMGGIDYSTVQCTTSDVWQFIHMWMVIMMIKFDGDNNVNLTGDHSKSIGNLQKKVCFFFNFPKTIR